MVILKLLVIIVVLPPVLTHNFGIIQHKDVYLYAHQLLAIGQIQSPKIVYIHVPPPTSLLDKLIDYVSLIVEYIPHMEMSMNVSAPQFVHSTIMLITPHIYAKQSVHQPQITMQITPPEPVS